MEFPFFYGNQESRWNFIRLFQELRMISKEAPVIKMAELFSRLREEAMVIIIQEPAEAWPRPRP